jgi:alkyl hydroperoxide reductase subunit F
LKTVFITESFGGQSTVSEGIENWIGTVKISGADLAKNLETHLRAYAGDVVDIKTGQRIKNIEDAGEHVRVTTEKGDSFEAKAVLITTGSTRRKLDIPGAAEFEHKGITYCASCDGPLFSGQDVTVLGGGNAALETVAQLSAYCKTVTLIIRGERFRADEITVQKVLSLPNVKSITNAKLLEVRGNKFVDTIVYENSDGKKIEHKTAGIFVEIGLLPTTGFVQGIVEMDKWNHIKVDPRTQKTSHSKIWAAGDCTDGLYHQNNIAAGDAVKALEDIYLALHAR